MAFCTKCGRPLEEGEICHCQDAANQIQQEPGNMEFDPYKAETQSTDGAPSENKDNLVININTDKIKDNISGALDKIGAGSSDENGTDIYERGKLIVPDCIKANDGEIPIKQYDFAKLRTRITLSHAEGRLQVTNKRVLFRATGRSLMGRTTLHEEFEIDEIAGVEIRNRYDFNILSLLGGIILTALFGALGVGAATLVYRAESEAALTVFELLALVFNLIVFALCVGATYVLAKRKSQDKFYSVRQILLSVCTGACWTYASFGEYFGGIPSEFMYFCAGFLSLCCLVNVFLIAFVPDLVGVIKTKGAAPGIEIKKEPQLGILSFLFKGEIDEKSGFQEVIPWKDTQIAIKELGTMIDDIQTMGDAAIEKWKV